MLSCDPDQPSAPPIQSCVARMQDGDMEAFKRRRATERGARDGPGVKAACNVGRLCLQTLGLGVAT